MLDLQLRSAKLILDILEYIDSDDEKWIKVKDIKDFNTLNYPHQECLCEEDWMIWRGETTLNLKRKWKKSKKVVVWLIGN
ncbi:MAG: hypothetical protein Ta2E_13310 [Mycoplasmoidaceae bacterium]|nr:MAG: hypothetical protein Ta2E_13310 [Mycoplasmoidaceae bacterium]